MSDNKNEINKNTKNSFLKMIITKYSVPVICIVVSKTLYTRIKVVIKLIIFNSFNQLVFSICSSYPINCNSMAASSNFITSNCLFTFKIKVSRFFMLNVSFKSSSSAGRNALN